jgi:hypothetical protein
MYANEYPNNTIVLNPSYSDEPQTGDTSITQLLAWTSNCQYPFIFDMTKTTASFLLGFSEFAVQASATLTSSSLVGNGLNGSNGSNGTNGLNGTNVANGTNLANGYGLSPYDNSTYGYTTFSYKNNRKIFMSLSNNVTRQGIMSPGVINLESARYLILRCPEIESHLLGSYVNFKYAPGIGLFKLMDSNSMMNLRFDFVNITRKPFHPIGKLPKLSLAFEMYNGNLYDFKGVDHVLLISIKYYAPRNILSIPRSKLNPYYLPNILEYQMKQYDDDSLRQQLKSNNDYSLEDVIREQKQYTSAK